MIVIDMDMPKKCMDCQLLGHDEMYCTLYPRKDLDIITVTTSKPDWCPIKCDVDDIKAEINDLSELDHIDADYEDCKADVLHIIDRNIRERSKDD